MLISEIFYSLQGEGELAGVPSVFIRTTGCNLRCRWCDTKYASWEPEGTEMSVEEIVDRVATHHAARHVVVTGGEPLVAKGIRDLMQALGESAYHRTIETAATVAPGGIGCDLASLSPKLSNSTPRPAEISAGWIARHEERRRRPAIVREWIEGYPFQLKFVVAEPADLEEIESILAEVDGEIPPHRILLMPEGVTTATLRGRDQTLVDLCKERGYRYCNRLHIELFGNQPGT